MKKSPVILEIQDAATDCIVQEIEFGELDLPLLCSLLGKKLPFFDDLEYDLTSPELELLRESLIGKLIPKSAANGHLRSRHPFDDLPYKLHTNRELLMMLEGVKPLAAFCDEFLVSELVNAPQYSKFDVQAAKGNLVKREHIEFDSINADICRRRTLFALPEETWRIDAYLLLWKTARITGWNDGFERMEGSLLGYSDEQNDLFMQYKKSVAQQINS
jgi:hypothetical protein